MLVKVRLSNGDIAMLTPEEAEKARECMKQRADWAAQVGRELKSMHPGLYGNMRLKGRTLADRAVSSHYDRSNDREMFTPHSPTELKAERILIRKAKFESAWKEIASK